MPLLIIVLLIAISIASGDPVRGESVRAESITAGISQIAADIPFPFVYDGRPSAELLSKWKKSEERHRSLDGAEHNNIAYTDPATGLQIECEAKVFSGVPAVEWVLRLTNTGSSDTPIIENIEPLDLHLTLPAKRDVILYHSY